MKTKLIPFLLSIALIFFSNLSLGYDWDESQKAGEITLKSIKTFDSKFNVIWWNVLYRTKNDKNVKILKNNLLNLSNELSSQTLIILGEANPKIWKEWLLNNFRHHSVYFIPYNDLNKHHFGIVIPNSIDHSLLELYKLNWAPNKAYKKNWIDTFPNAKGFDRTAVEIQVVLGGEKFSIYPIHLNQPWAKYMESQKLLESSNDPLGENKSLDWYSPLKITGYLRILQKLWRSKETPLYFQTQNLMNYLVKRDFYNSSILIGDFNIPKYVIPYPLTNTIICNRKISPLMPAAYELLSNYFSESSPHICKGFTYPSKLARQNVKYPRLPIDHALVSKDILSRTQILSLKGSDHYPIVFQKYLKH